MQRSCARFSPAILEWCLLKQHVLSLSLAQKSCGPTNPICVQPADSVRLVIVSIIHHNIRRLQSDITLLAICMDFILRTWSAP